MTGVASMAAAINPADKSLVVVIELLLWMRIEFRLLPRSSCGTFSCVARPRLRIGLIAAHEVPKE
jgi:hypothetical protein